MPVPFGFALCAAFGSAIVVTFIAVAAGATHQPAWVLLPFGALTVGAGIATTWGAAIATAWICWALDSGFVIGREAQLTFGPQSQLAALVLVALALVSGLGARMYRAARPVAERSRIRSL
jgi:hypothetical protein